MYLGLCSCGTGGVDSIASSSSTWDANASSHFSLETSTPPVFSALHGRLNKHDAYSHPRDVAVTYPANEPPTQAINAGANAGALPAFAAARGDDAGCGAGLLRIAM